MKKLLVLVLLFTVTIAQAQKNKKAVELADKLSEVMQLDDDNKVKLLELILLRNKDKAALRKEYANDIDTFKERAKEVEKTYNKDLKKLVGEDKFKLLIAYRKAQKAAKN